MDPSTETLLEALFEAAAERDREKAEPIIKELARRIDSFERSLEDGAQDAQAARSSSRI
jgi:hypothetical protein